jgi:hypothetical protein
MLGVNKGEGRMNAFRLALGTLMLPAVAVSAQETTTPKVEVGLNYSWLHVNSANYDYQRTGNGGSGYIEYNLNRTVGLVGDFGGYANTRAGINDKALTYLFGPRFNMRRFERLTPYVQFLFGAAYAWSGPNSFSAEPEHIRDGRGRRLGLQLYQAHLD